VNGICPCLNISIWPFAFRKNINRVIKLAQPLAIILYVKYGIHISKSGCLVSQPYDIGLCYFCKKKLQYTSFLLVFELLGKL
jgi:hypothetical protein